ATKQLGLRIVRKRAWLVGDFCGPMGQACKQEGTGGVMYGYRARIGYCSPPFVTEGFCYEFYMMAPPGVTLMITTLAVKSLTSKSTKVQMEQSHAKSLEAAKSMARAGADVVVLGGNPINQSRGVENLDEICAALAREIGTKVVTSTHAQTHAL